MPAAGSTKTVYQAGHTRISTRLMGRRGSRKPEKPRAPVTALLELAGIAYRWPPDVALPPLDIRFTWLGLADIPGAGVAPEDISGTEGDVKLPDCSRASSSWFSWFATLLPCKFGNAVLLCELARA